MNNLAAQASANGFLNKKTSDFRVIPKAGSKLTLNLNALSTSAVE